MEVKDLNPDPFLQFANWFQEALTVNTISYPEAMCVSSLGEDGYPQSRYVLMKDHGPEGFVFYTNLNSNKAKSIQHHPKVALNFYWMPLDRQIRIRGDAEPVSVGKVDKYFASRARRSQLGAWASDQSAELESREELIRRLEEVDKRFEGREVERPPHWQGFVVKPVSFQFWLQIDNRLHDSFLYEPAGGDKWKITRRNP